MIIIYIVFLTMVFAGIRMRNFVGLCSMNAYSEDADADRFVSVCRSH